MEKFEDKSREIFRQIIQKGVAPIRDVEELGATINSLRTIGKKVVKIHATPHGMHLLMRENNRYRMPNDPFPKGTIGYQGITAFEKPPSSEVFTVEWE